MTTFIYWQQNGGEELWQEAMVTGRAALVEKHNPMFMTVLALSQLPQAGATREELDAMKYDGPLYFDFDGETLDDVVPKWQEFLVLLQEREVDLAACALFATGGRGFHCEIPMAMFLAKPPKAGVPFLPAIYKEMAFEMFVDTMDMRVYTARRGRMWRCPNVQRSNGKYKVPLTPTEALNVTPESYLELCSAPRQAPVLAKPALNQKLTIAYAKAEQKVAAAMKRRKNAAKDTELLNRFKGEFPPSLLKVMAGETAEGMGFHPIAMQIGITANAIGVPLDKVLPLCEGLIANHQSDGTRYNSPAKRRAEIERMYTYTHGNVCYTYSKDAVKKLVPRDVPTPDLDGVPEGAGVISSDDDGGMSEGMFMTEAGIYAKAEYGPRIICDASFRSVQLLKDAHSGKALGFEAEILVAGVPRGRVSIGAEALQSRTAFNRLCGQFMCSFKGTDNHAAALMSIMRRTSEMTDNTIYVLAREGLDVLQRPDTDEDILDMVWVSPSGIETQSPVRYMFRGSPDVSGIFKSDLMLAPQFEPTEAAKQVLLSMFEMNEPYVIANALGWFVSCVHRQLYHRLLREFPALHFYGTAGSGKTQTYMSFAPLFYYKNKPHELNVAEGTNHSLQSHAHASASLPALFDEYKPQVMPFNRTQKIKSILRSAYNGLSMGKGGMAEGLGTSWKDIRTYEYSTPILFCAEAMETETAVLDRSIVVPLSKAGMAGRHDHRQRVLASGRTLSSFGRELVGATFIMDMERWKARVLANKEITRQLLEFMGKDRPETNIAVILSGLDFLHDVLQAYYPSVFTEKIAQMKEVAMDKSQIVTLNTMSEGSKVLNQMSFISRSEDPDSEWGLKLGVDYEFWPTQDMAKKERVSFDPAEIDLDLKRCFYKYVGWAKRKHQMPLFETEEAFARGMHKHPAVTDRAARTSPLSVRGFEKIFRFSVAKLTEEGVEPFRQTA